MMLNDVDVDVHQIKPHTRGLRIRVRRPTGCMSLKTERMSTSQKQ